VDHSDAGSAVGRSRLPALVPPMLATLGELPTRPGWAFELKWDGVRAVTYAEHGRVRVVSRNDLDVSGHYPELAAVADWLAGRDAIVDGEIVALDEAGRPSFARLQERMHVRSPTPALPRRRRASTAQCRQPTAPGGSRPPVPVAPLGTGCSTTATASTGSTSPTSKASSAEPGSI
jgi:ATP-dependent DNA ligase